MTQAANGASGQRIQARGALGAMKPFRPDMKRRIHPEGRPVGSQRTSYPRVPLVPRSTRGYFLATTPWFVVESSAAV